MLAREQARGLSIEQIRQEIERRMTEAIIQRAQELNPDIPAVLAGHVTVNGATVGSERSMMLGNDHVLNVSAVQQPQLEYVALGHIHKHQILRPPATDGVDGIGPAVAYSGSLQRVDFSEEADDKGFCVIDIDPAAPQGRRLTDFRFERIAARPFVTVDANLPENEANPTEFVTRAIARHPVAGAIVRLRIRLSGEQSAPRPRRRLAAGAVVRPLRRQHLPRGNRPNPPPPGLGTYRLAAAGRPAPLPGKPGGQPPASAHHPGARRGTARLR